MILVNVQLIIIGRIPIKILDLNLIIIEEN